MYKPLEPLLTEKENGLYNKAISYKFDYEKNKAYNRKTDDTENSAKTTSNKNRLPAIDYSNISDTFPDCFVEKYYQCNLQSNNCVNRLLNGLRHCVSGTRIRMIDQEYDLDLVYITRRIIAMGYPSDKMLESFYRNPVEKVRHYFKDRLKNKVKIYNLCLEEDKIYSKSYFAECEVSLFPISDHCCCPIQ